MAMLCRRSKSQSGSHSGNTPLALAEGWSPPSMVSSRRHSQVECTSWSNWPSIFFDFFLLNWWVLRVMWVTWSHLWSPETGKTAAFGAFFSRHSGEDDWPSRGRARQRKRLDYLMQPRGGVGRDSMKNVSILLFTIMIWDFSRKQLQLWVTAVAKNKIFNLDFLFLEILSSNHQERRAVHAASLSFRKNFTTGRGRGPVFLAVAPCHVTPLRMRHGFWARFLVDHLVISATVSRSW